MAIATYSLIAVPVGQVTKVPSNSLDVPLHVLTNLQFDSGDIPQGEVIRALEANVVLLHPDRLRAELTDASGTVFACELSPTFADGEVRLQALKEYLLGLGTDRKQMFSVIKPKHDEEFDTVPADRYVNVGSIYERTVPLRNYMAYAVASDVLNRAKAARPQAFTVDHLNLARVMSYVMRLIHETALGNGDAHSYTDLPLGRAVARVGADSALLEVLSSTLRSEKQRFIELVTGASYPRRTGLSDAIVPQEELSRRLATGDLNVLLQAAVREPLLASHFGLSTAWRLRVPADAANKPLRVALIWPSAAASGSVTRAPAIPTAFKIAGVLAAPASRNAARVHGAFVELNDARSVARYAAVQVNADSEITKTFVLQDSNRIDPSHARQKSRDRGALPTTADPLVKNDPDISDPEKEQTHGANQPSTSGITIYSPVEDLVVTDPIARGVYYFEDLWVGYRLDIRNVDNDKGYLSIHEQRVEFSVGGGGPVRIAGRTEDYFDREHLIRDKRVDTVCAKWTGLGSAQCMPLAAERVNETPLELGSQLQRCAIQSEGTAPRLVYRGNYEYRLRSVFCGGISISLADANHALSVSPISTVAQFRQAFTFSRTEAFSPGDLVANVGSDVPAADRQSAEQVMVVRDKGCAIDLRLAPTPLTLDQARFHALVGQSGDEFNRFRTIYFVSDVRAFLASSNDSSYLCDPDVSRVRFLAKCVTFNPIEPTRSINTGDVICDLVPHWTFADEIVSYGDGDWTTFRPILIRAHSTHARLPRLQITRSWGRPVVDIYVPPGDVVVLTIIPQISRQLAENTAFVADMHKSVYTLGRDSTSSAKLRGIAWELLPPIVNTRLVTLINPTQRPVDKPEVRTLRLRRGVDEHGARVDGLVRLDARTTATQHFAAHWEDLEDEVNAPEPTVAPKSARSDGRNVKFEEMTVPAYAQFVRDMNAAYLSLAGNQCIENSVLHVIDTPNTQEPTPTSPLGSRIDFPDTRRRVVTLEAVARSRYRAYFPKASESDCETRSKPIVIDLENCAVPRLPQIARIRPMLSRQHEPTPRGDRVRDSFALRIYVNRPWMVTGPDERLAIACSGERDNVTEEVRSLSSDWGEDPLERPHLSVTRRRPRATDFTSLNPEKVAYYDNVVTSPRDTGPSQPQFVALASYALDYDRNEQAWCTTIAMRAAFFGWIRLALYRHQPHSIERCHLSPMPVAAYVNVTQEELITYSEDRNGWRVEIGPVYDRSISFDAVAVEPIAAAVYIQRASALEFQSYDVERARMHYLVIKPGATYSIRKRRAGVVQASLGTVPPHLDAGAK